MVEAYLSWVDPGYDSKWSIEQAEDEVHGYHCTELIVVVLVKVLRHGSISNKSCCHTACSDHKWLDTSVLVEDQKTDGAVNNRESTADSDDEERRLRVYVEDVINARAIVVYDVDSRQWTKSLDSASKQESLSPRGLHEYRSPRRLVGKSVCQDDVSNLPHFQVHQAIAVGDT